MSNENKNQNSDDDKAEKLFHTLIGGGIIISVMGVLVSLTFTIGVIYVAWHFISKFW